MKISFNSKLQFTLAIGLSATASHTATYLIFKRLSQVRLRTGGITE